MTPPKNIEALLTTGRDLLAQGKNFNEIENMLTGMGHGREDIAEAMTHIRDVRYQQQRSIGIPLIALGVILCVVGFVAVVTMTQHDTMFNVALYGFTGVGSTSIIGGLFAIMG